MADSFLSSFGYYVEGLASFFLVLLFIGLVYWVMRRVLSTLWSILRRIRIPRSLRVLVWKLDKRCTNCGGYPKLPGRPLCQPCSLSFLRAFGVPWPQNLA
jgi:hypothetical protein